MSDPDLQEPVAGAEPETRRQFLVTKLAAGFSLAISPACAQTITTDANGLTAGEVKIPVAGGEIPGYRAMPSRGSNLPVVVVVEELFGVHEHIKDVCRRFAKAGYCAVAPELFARQGDVSRLTDVQQILDTVVSKVPDTQVMGDLDSTVEWAIRSSRGNRQRVALAGFCWGGRIVWLYAALGTKAKTAAAFYGRLQGPTNPLTPKQPVDYVGVLKISVLGFYGGKDASIPKSSVEAMQAALSVTNSSSKIIVYPNADHGFYADYRPTYDKEAAQDAWSKMLMWFKEDGV
jgi:carboxymethylenebutenolidase